MIAFLLDHLWQSTLFAAAAGFLTLLFRANSAAVRYWLWFAASVKFLIPFSLLTALGAYLFQAIAPKMPARILIALKPAAEPFSGVAPALVPSAPPDIGLAPLLLGLWALGFAVTLAIWLHGWLKLRAAMADASPLPLDAPMPVKSSTALLEPGLVGIWRPVLLLPQGIATHLSPLELRAVLAHEACHLRRRDNLLAAVHMLVQALFWFYPLVWWLGTRLIFERENACDQAVLASGSDPQIYAQGILKVCQFYLRAPLACASGISGADLKKRIKAIMEAKFAIRLNAAKKALLAVCAVMAVVAPLSLGLLTVPAASALVAIRAIASPNMTAGQGAAPRTDESLAENIPAAPALRLESASARRGVKAAPADSEKPGQDDHGQLSRMLAVAVTSQVTRELQQIDNLWPVKPVATKSVGRDATALAPPPPSPAGSNPIAAHGVRPEIARLLRKAELLSNAVHPDETAVMEKIKAAEAMPNLNRDEKIRVTDAEANLPAGNHSGFDTAPVLTNGAAVIFSGPANQLGQSMYSYLPPSDPGAEYPIR